jgi:hypothetical protein
MAALGSIDPAAIPNFSLMNNTIGSWSLSNVYVLPGSMSASGGVVTGTGTIATASDGTDLGQQLAVAMGDPSEQGVQYWTLFSKALVAHMKAFGQVVGSTFGAPTPGPGALTGTGAVSFSSLVMVPLLSVQMGVTDVTAAALLEVMGVQTLTGIQQNASVVPISIQAPFLPLTNPTDGSPVTGSGSIT